MGKIQLNNMRFNGRHGVLPQEHIVGTTYRVNIAIDSDTRQAEEKDELEGTINYAEVYQTVKKEMAQESALIENVCYRIQQALIKQFTAIEKMTVTVTKEHPPVGGEMESASITLEYAKK